MSRETDFSDSIQVQFQIDRHVLQFLTSLPSDAKVHGEPVGTAIRRLQQSLALRQRILEQQTSTQESV